MPNKTEEMAIRLLRQRYGKIVDVRGRGLGYDLKLNNRRLVEVKSRRKNYEKSSFHIFLSKKELETFKNRKDAYVFAVYNLSGKPKLKIFSYNRNKPKIRKITRYQMIIDGKRWKSVRTHNL